ncbi:MAG: hypothetical protein CFE26_14230 [Verrucomicrobiales bacterium VVV1]|nr:MAG: hypothetical protein CFE26_14230 [Verrucomicrobiales bacterium VVV1]
MTSKGPAHADSRVQALLDKFGQVISVLPIVFAVVMAFAMSGLAIMEPLNHAAVRKEGIDVIALTESVSTQDRKGNTIFILGLGYDVGSGTIHQTQEVPKALFDKYSENSRFTTPQPISIRYLPRSPRCFEISDPIIPADHYDFSPITAICAIVLWLVVISCIKSKIRKRKLREAGFIQHP